MSSTGSSDIDAVAFIATPSAGSTSNSLAHVSARFDPTSVSYGCVRIGGTAPAHLIRCDTTVPQLTVGRLATFDTIIAE